jgi:hypothetical protein
VSEVESSGLLSDENNLQLSGGFSDQLIGCRLPLNYYPILLMAYGSASINNKVVGRICCGGSIYQALLQAIPRQSTVEVRT